MNVFILDLDPIKAAQQQCDKHVIKMILESAQLLCTAIHLHGGTAPYRATHKNHPCAIWARQTKGNFDWLKRHGLALCAEYTARYGKTHKTEVILKSLSDELIPDGPQTAFAMAMPEHFKTEDVVTSYRNYYMGAKRDIATWKRNKPDWWK